MSESTVHLGENKTQYICTIYGWFSGIEVEEVHEPIVRCRDCMYAYHDECPKYDKQQPDGFCAWGERKDG